MDIKIDVYDTGEYNPLLQAKLADAVKELDLGKPYSDMIRLRVSGKAAAQCRDIYYIATDNGGELVSRLWMGWGRHKGAVGNWGNFFTEPELRGRGIGKSMLKFWIEDVKNRDDAPLALFCTAGKDHLAELYRPYGWRPAIKGTTCGPLYCPLGNSPESFEQFRDEYYKPARELIFKPASLEWRHEIDCLFKFAMLTLGQDYLPRGVESLEKALLDRDESVRIIFTDTGIPVGLSKTQQDGQKDIRIYPTYLHLI